MNDRELDELLKSSKTPARPDEYWRDFLKRVTAKLHWAPKATASTTRPAFDPLAIWGIGLVAACFVAIAVIHLDSKNQKQAQSGLTPQSAQTSQPPKDEQLAEARKCYREIEPMFTNQLAAIVFDQKGPHMILADKADLPNSTPIYVKACTPSGCVAFVTFSGQRVPFNGETCEVLSDEHDRVMLVGSHHVWSQSDAPGAVQIEAKLL